jgi:hypothetical protein
MGSSRLVAACRRGRDIWGNVCVLTKKHKPAHRCWILFMSCQVESFGADEEHEHCVRAEVEWKTRGS